MCCLVLCKEGLRLLGDERTILSITLYLLFLSHWPPTTWVPKVDTAHGYTLPHYIAGVWRAVVIVVHKRRVVYVGCPREDKGWCSCTYHI